MEKPKRIPGQVVYVQLRVYEPTTKKMRNCRGLSLRFEKFTPEEVHGILVTAVLNAVPTARIIGGGST
jgi:hypothetical protein